MKITGRVVCPVCYKSVGVFEDGAIASHGQPTAQDRWIERSACSASLRSTVKAIPSRVLDVYEYYDEPPGRSNRCLYWVEQIKAGWRPNSRIRTLGYDSKAEFYGVYVWEYINVIAPLLEQATSWGGLDRKPWPT